MAEDAIGLPRRGTSGEGHWNVALQWQADASSINQVIGPRGRLNHARIGSPRERTDRADR